MCDINGCQDAPTVRTGTIGLCARHSSEQNFPRTQCAGCNRIVAIAGTVFVRHSTLGAPSNIVLCETCVPLPRVGCTKCARVLRVGDVNVVASTSYDNGAVRLCGTCNSLPRVGCTKCARVLRVGDANVVASASYDGGAVLLCGTCNSLPRVGCTRCALVLRVGDANVVASTSYDNGAVRLCGTCNALPRVGCARCARVLRVGDASVFASTSHGDGAVVLCRDCNALISQECRACGLPAACTARGGTPTALPNASFIHQADDRNVIVGWRCSVCSVNPLADVGQAQPYYNAAVLWMTGWAQGCGVTYPAYGARLTWSVERDATFTMDGGGRELGNCLTTRGGVQTTHRIQVLFYMRPISFQGTLVHELTHALTNELGYGNKPLIEGFCNYVSYLFLTNIVAIGGVADRAEARRALARMEANQDATYGVNFRRVRDALAAQPAQALNWLRDS